MRMEAYVKQTRKAVIVVVVTMAPTVRDSSSVAK